MNKIKLTLSAFILLATSTWLMAGGTSSPAFKNPAKRQGVPSMAGLGTQVSPNQILGKNTGILRSLNNMAPAPKVKELRYAPDQKTPVFLKSEKVITTTAKAGKEALQSAAFSFMEEHKNWLNIKSPKDEFLIKAFETDELGITHIKMSQTYMGYAVWGKEMILHFGPKGTTVNGRWTTTPTIPAISNPISAAHAEMITRSDAFGAKSEVEFNPATKALLNYSGATTQLVLYPKDVHNPVDRWAYLVTIRTNFIDMYQYFIDVATGEIISKTDIACSTGPAVATLTDLNGVSQLVNTYQDNTGTYNIIDVTRPMFSASQSQLPANPVGALWTLNANFAGASNIQVAQLTSTDDVSFTSSATAASASVNAATAYTFYLNNHQRNSIDGQGGNIISVINVNDDQGQPMDNAFWNGQLMAYGNGNVYFKPLAGGLDVAGHEMTHGVIQSTANLQYKDQSGALNESLADVFGVLISGSNYTIGSTVTLTSFIPTGVLRNLADPHNSTTQGNPGWQPAVMSEYVSTTDDNGGVHTNSGIPNHAFYYFATAVTKTVADQVYYRALTKYLTSTSQFLDERIAVTQAAADLYGASSSQVQAAESAFDQVGIYNGTNTQPLDTASVNGTDWIMYQSTNPANPNQLYLIPGGTTLSSGDFHPMNTLPTNGRVSVTDDGSLAYFVDTSNNIYSITTDYTNPVQTQITNTGDWDFVAVSRDGQNLALISDYIDTAIYVYNIANQQYAKFHLFDPTFSQDSTITNGPIYAGSADWSPNGENVIYDEKNVLTNPLDSAAISYWDIGVINVWNSSNTSFATGAINKLVNSLPAGISIGNPEYSKNHADIVAFDQKNDSTGTYNTLGANINTGTIGTILSGNLVPSIPSYSGADNLITYTFQDGQGNLNIGTQAVGADFINGTGSASGLVDSAEWSVWFRKGTRNTQCEGLVVNITAIGSTYPFVDSVILDAGAGYSSYQWSTGDNTERITVYNPGSYNVVVTQNACTLTSAYLTVGSPLGINTVPANEVKIYPIPTTGLLSIDLIGTTGYLNAEVWDMTGRLLLSQSIKNAAENINLNNLANGVYMLRLKDDTGSKVYTSRIVKD